MTDTFMAAATPTFRRSPTALLGPADADHYRVKVGRYGDRWYHDPLDADDLWPAWNGEVPSISIVKKASGSDWTFVGLKRVAHRLEHDPHIFDGMNFDARYEQLKIINKLGLSEAAKRGTGIHLYCESKLHGDPQPIPEGRPGHEYMRAVDAWFDQHQPELVAAEYVIINRTLHDVGYGGTPDGLIRIAGKVYAIDWKSRGWDSDHGAYPEEAEQVAAGVSADYMIIDRDGTPTRVPIPDVEAGLIISIRPDGCRTYPIDIGLATRQWEARHAWWIARQDERRPVGKPWPTTKLPPIGDRLSNLRDRCRAIAELSEAGRDYLALNLSVAGIDLRTANTHTDLDAAQQIIEAAERHCNAPFADLTPEPVDGRWGVA